DLGLAEENDQLLSEEASSVLHTYFRLGRLSLLPSKKQISSLPEDEQEKFVTEQELATIDRSAGYCFERYAVKSHWGWFVPVTLYEKWKEENATYEAEFLELKERLLANYDAIKAAVLRVYR